MKNKVLIPPGFDLLKYSTKGKRKLSYSDWVLNQASRYETNINYEDDPGHNYESMILENISAGIYWADDADVSVDFPPVGSLTTRMIRNQLPDGTLLNAGEMDEHISQRYFQCFHLFANLDYSDEVLTKQFAEWLKYVREKHNIPVIDRSVTDALLANVLTTMALPYIDVVQWNRLHNRKLTQPQMFSIIYPDEIDRNESIIQTTKKNAEWFLQLETSFEINKLIQN